MFKLIEKSTKYPVVNSDLTSYKDIPQEEQEIVKDLIKDSNLDINNVYRFDVKYQLNNYVYIKKDIGLFIEIHDSFSKIYTEKVVKQIEDGLKDQLKNKDYSYYFLLVDSKYRINMLNNLYFDIPNNNKCEVFDFVYSRNSYRLREINPDIIEDINKRNKIYYKTKSFEDLGFKKENVIEDKLIVYRGENKSSNPNGISWTTDIEVAKFFASRFDQDGYILKGLVKKENIIRIIEEKEGVLNCESEVLIYREDIEELETL